MTLPTPDELGRALEQIFSSVRLGAGDDQDADGLDAEVRSAGQRFRLRLVRLPVASLARLAESARRVRSAPSRGTRTLQVVAARYLGPDQQQLLRDARMPFLDLAGNAWLVLPPVHIDRRGFANPEPEQRASRSPFSDKATLVLRVLLDSEAPVGIRQLAQTVAHAEGGIPLTPGYVSKVVQELERRGHVARREPGIVLTHADELLRDWISDYRGRRPVEVRRRFLPAPEASRLMPRLARSLDEQGVAHVFGGQAGASLVDPHAEFDVVDVLVQDLEAADAVVETLGARPVARGWNVNLTVPGYRVSAFFGAQRGRGAMRAASDLQLYLDLYDLPDRGREQAEHLYERRLRKQVERTRA
jgi:hypothetical protein